MTDQTHEQATAGASAEAAAEAETIAQEGPAGKVRERIRETVVRIAHERKLDFNELSSVAGDVMDGAVEGVKELAPQDRESTLRQVVDGLADAFSRTANATRLALQETAGRGQAFTRTEVEKTINDLRTLQDRFIDVLTRTTSSAGREISDQIESINTHIRRTADSVRPSIENALRAAADHPVKLAGETASASVRAVPKATGMLLQAVGGFLQGAGDALAGAGRETGQATDESKHE